MNFVKQNRVPAVGDTVPVFVCNGEFMYFYKVTAVDEAAETFDMSDADLPGTIQGVPFKAVDNLGVSLPDDLLGTPGAPTLAQIEEERIAGDEGFREVDADMWTRDILQRTVGASSAVVFHGQRSEKHEPLFDINLRGLDTEQIEALVDHITLNAAFSKTV